MAAVDQVDPASAGNGGEYVQALQRLRVSAGKPSLREMSRRANAKKPGSLPVSTLSDALRKGDLPAWRLVDAILGALDVSAGRMQRWRTSWQRLAEPTELIERAGGERLRRHAEHSADIESADALPRTKDGRARDVPIHPRQKDHAAEELASWLKRTLVRPNKHRNEERYGVFQINHLSRVDPGESKQMQADIKPGEDVGCWAEHPLLQYQPLYHCFAKDSDADVLVESQLPNLFWAKIRCLGQLRVIETDMVPWDDEDRGVSYNTAYLISEVAGPDAAK